MEILSRDLSETNDRFEKVKTMSNQLSIATPNLKVVFAKSAEESDRWSHRVVLCNGDAETVLLTSVEGDDQQTWPPSAPLQDISHHDLPGGEAVLGVGMAGKSHWSASVSVIQDNAIFFDMACLIKQSGAAVGSQYRAQPGVHVAPHGDDVFLEVGDQKIVIQPFRNEGQQTQVTLDATNVSIAPDINLATVTGSVRWCFHVRLVD
jgi:hypothetical protein